MERVIIGQRELGIIAPLKDVNGYDELVTDHMSMCYTFAVRDPEAQVGLLTHVDPMGEFSLRKTIRNASPVLQELGARRVTVETANVMGRWSKDIFIEGAMGELEKSGLEIMPATDAHGNEHLYTDVGPAYGAILNLQSGLQPFLSDELTEVLTAVELAKLQELTSWKKFLRHSVFFVFSPSIRLAYQPET